MLSSRGFAIIVYGSVVALGLGGALMVAFGSQRLAAALLCLAVAGTVAVAFVSVRTVVAGKNAAGRALRDGVAELRREVGALRSVVRDLDRSSEVESDTRLDELSRSLAAVRSGLEGHRRESRVQGEQLPSAIIDLARASDNLVRNPSPLPVLGGWALSVPTMLAVLDEVRGPRSARTVVECGSGASTVWLAMAVREAGAGHVWSLEHDEKYAAETTRHLEVHGLVEHASVIHAPIETFVLAGRLRSWYSRAALARLPEQIDLLLVDGPPASVAADARLPAFPLLAARLQAGSTVVLDDTVRADEQSVRTFWQNEVFDGRSLADAREVGRSTMFSVRVQGLAIDP